MNRYPLWKYAIIAFSVLVAVIYALPNLFGEAPAVQVSAGKVTARVDGGTLSQVEQALGSVGCYRLEGPGAQLFSSIEGDYFTILGLPLMGLLDLFRRHGVLKA